MKRFLGLAFLVFLLLIPVLSWGRGGGGCLEEGTLVHTPGGLISIEKLKIGDRVWSVTGGRLKEARVQAVLQVHPEAFLEISAGGSSLRVTPEHPVMTAPGEYLTAERLLLQETVFLLKGDKLIPTPIRSIKNIKAKGPAYNLLVIPGGTFLAGDIALHNKGCFLPDSPILMADGREAMISAVRPGDLLWSFKPDGHLVSTRAQSVIRHEVDEYILLKTDRAVLRVTAEHPFFVGQGKFKTVEALKAGDTIMAFDGKWLVEQRIVSIKKVHQKVRVYNLQTDQPNTFFVHGLAVHNKGGGCFPTGTAITTPQGRKTIEELTSGDEVLAINDNGLTVRTRVKTIFINKSPLVRVETRTGNFLTTRDHPIHIGQGRFRQAGDLQAGDPITRWEQGRLIQDKILRMDSAAGQGLVFNLEVDNPHTFIAEGFVVHNKGGGGSFGGSRSSSGSRGGGSGGSLSFFQFLFIFFFFILFFVVIIAVLGSIASKSIKNKSENLDYVYPRNRITPKTEKTGKLLAFLSQQDSLMTPTELRQLAEATFLKLQECWGKRDYGPMGTLLMPALFTQHTAQLQGLLRNHEINRLDQLKVEEVDLVNVRYTEKASQREFTALITASARDYYLDDRTGKFLRGDHTPAPFQEFWTFQLMNGRWLLREIEQAGESDVLKEDNFAEMLTDETLEGIYGEKAASKGESGPWLEKDVEQKANRIDRLLNFLSQTDKLWDRNRMLERARKIFLDVYLARESGDPARVPVTDLFPGVTESLRTQLAKWKEAGIIGEYRNFCVRKVELLLVRNYGDNSRDEFMSRISAHAQQIIRQSGEVLREEAYVTPFEEYWTFGRLDGQWKLKEILPPGRGKKEATLENIDEESPPDQLQWYYRQPRAN
ncbi:MAG: TIM44-like domain-containing protein [Deltaproteobacteria bacterium]|nr:TIM44-like domain-containing protein [Deltaproteobacteria bacterium]